jgi:sodium/potassium-transporting ATPase subunit beta
LGRTCYSWLLVSIFYIIYYACLLGFSGGMLYFIMNVIIQEDIPHLTGQNSLLRVGPGVSFQPNFPDKADRDDNTGTFIHISLNKEHKLFKRYVKHMEEFKANRPHGIADCTQVNSTKQDISKACKFYWLSLEVCADPTKALSTGHPCMYLKINKIYGWVPDLEAGYDTPLVQCSGQNPADVENLGTIKYHPEAKVTLGTGDKITAGRISHVYFPYIRQQNYTSPLVALDFKDAKRNVPILVQCKVMGIGATPEMTKFEIMVDE